MEKDKNEIMTGKEYNKEFRKKEIIELLERIENPATLKLIYGLVKSGYKEEKAGSE